ncbi:hypothetical protein [Ligilactobacillus ruminis]|uniref:hypothetical protein n=1 Tax=Ligilactobacillus ruminis TaxID=1623 RepID=UPI0034A13D2B
MPEFCLPLPSKMARGTSEVDKNRAKSPNFVYRCPRNRTDSSAVILGSAAKISLHAAHLHSALSKCSIASPLHPKALDLKKRTAENRTVLEMCRVYLFLSY